MGEDDFEGEGRKGEREGNGHRDSGLSVSLKTEKKRK